MNVLSNSTIICKSGNISSTNALGEWAGVGVQINASNIIVAADASINADGQGDKIFGSNSEGNGPGGGVFADYYGGGGGHGGNGGNGYGGNADGGSSYGDAFVPEELGSAGACGTTGTTPVGYGGGAIRLEVQDTLTLDGSISAHGNNGGVYRAAGGAGGSVLAHIYNELTGSGNFTADGGDGGEQSGGGGGGRIAVYYRNNNFFDGFAGSTTDGGIGGINAFDGEKGTLYLFGEPVITITTT
ncbi:MAG: hypothetical protein GY869_22350, partial [Planctomycetes bacterium]|nr:hypothetical protein [Planctomycetota bacterium]